MGSNRKMLGESFQAMKAEEFSEFGANDVVGLVKYLAQLSLGHAEIADSLCNRIDQLERQNEKLCEFVRASDAWARADNDFRCREAYVFDYARERIEDIVPLPPTEEEGGKL